MILLARWLFTTQLHGLLVRKCKDWVNTDHCFPALMKEAGVHWDKSINKKEGNPGKQPLHRSFPCNLGFPKTGKPKLPKKNGTFLCFPGCFVSGSFRALGEIGFWFLWTAGYTERYLGKNCAKGGWSNGNKWATSGRVLINTFFFKCRENLCWRKHILNQLKFTWKWAGRLEDVLNLFLLGRSPAYFQVRIWLLVSGRVWWFTQKWNGIGCQLTWEIIPSLIFPLTWIPIQMEFHGKSRSWFLHLPMSSLAELAVNLQPSHRST